VIGSSSSDLILGDRHNNRLLGDRLGPFGGEGKDVVRGRGGNDQLLGAAGDGNLDGGSGRNSINGGQGVDTCTNPARGPRVHRCELVGRTG
jgi:Ca2+-binding RTX toxin-like protein